MRSILVLIPAYQVEASLRKLVAGIAEQAPNTHALIVNDGSTDGTDALGRELADASADVSYVAHDENRGKGAALRTGFAWGLEHGYDAVITIDGDGQHPPESIPDFVARLEETGADLIVGSRTRRHTDMPLHRRASNKITTWLASRWAGTKLPDSQSGFRLVTRPVLERVKLETTRYETETELLIKAARAGFRIEGVPIPTIYDDETSHIDAWNDTLRFLKLLRDLRLQDD